MNPVIRFVEKGLKFVKLAPTFITFSNLTFFGVTLNEHKIRSESDSVAIYRSQVTRDEDWYQMLSELSGLEFALFSLISLGDDFKQPIYER